MMVAMSPDPTTTSTPSRTLDDTFVDELCAFIEGEVSQIDDPIEPDTDLLLTGAVDSLGVVMIVEWIERRLDTSVDPGDVVLEHFQTVAAMERFLSGG